MKKKIFNLISLFIIITITISVLKNSKIIMESVIYSYNLWINNIIPSLFPFFILSELLIRFGFVEFISELFKGITTRLFKMRGETAFVLIMSMISGFPSSSKYIKELYLNNKINNAEATKLLTFTHFSNPLFILGTIAASFLNDIKSGIIILISHYISNIIIGIIIRNYEPYNIKEKISLRRAINLMNEKINNSKEKLGTTLSNAIINTIKTLIIIFGTVTIFLCLTTLICKYLKFSPFKESLLKGIFEMTQGLKYISLLNISLKIKTILSAVIISFGGLSVHLQIISILGDTDIKYFPFLLARIIHAILAILICLLIFLII